MKEKLYSKLQNTQLKFTSSMLTIETLEKVLNMFKVNNKNTGVFIGNFQNIFTPFPSVPTVHFEQVNVSCNHLQKNFRQTIVFMSIFSQDFCQRCQNFHFGRRNKH